MGLGLLQRVDDLLGDLDLHGLQLDVGPVVLGLEVAGVVATGVTFSTTGFSGKVTEGISFVELKDWDERQRSSLQIAGELAAEVTGQ